MSRFDRFWIWAMCGAPEWVGYVVTGVGLLFAVAVFTILVALLMLFPLQTFIGLVVLALYLLNHIWAMFLRAEARKDVKGQDDE